jgi:hypothetical protein
VTANNDIKIEHVLNVHAGEQQNFSASLYCKTYNIHIHDLTKWLTTQRNSAKVWQDIVLFYAQIQK